MSVRPSRSSYIAAPRGAGLLGFLNQLARANNVTLFIDGHDKGWFSEIIHYTIQGDVSNLNTFMRGLKSAADEFNKDD